MSFIIIPNLRLIIVTLFLVGLSCDAGDRRVVHNVSIFVEFHLLIFPIFWSVLIKEKFPYDHTVDVNKIDFVIDRVQIFDGSDPLTQQESIRQQIWNQME